MKFWGFSAALTVCFLQGFPTQTAVASERPNIVLLVTDDQRHDAVGFLHPVLETPHIDSLAQSGVWFTSALVTTPICSASRATLLTGLHERTHRHEFGAQLPIEMLEASYPRLLRNAGYLTGFVGKNGTDLDEERKQLLFDHYVQVNRNPYIRIRESELIHATDYTADKAVQFIEQQTPTQPFLLTVAFNAPHAEDGDPEQFIPPSRYADLYQGIDHPDPPLSEPEFFEGLPLYLQEVLNRVRWFWRWTPELYDGMLSGYLAMIRGVDDAVGEILEAIETNGLYDNTVVILISDNGAFIGERGYAGKWLAYEPSVRVPLIISDPRQDLSLTNRAIDQIALNVDVPETILDLAGVAIPTIMQGRSLMPLVRGGLPTWRTDTFLEHSWSRPPSYVIPRHESLRTDRFKYINYPDLEHEELYDLSSDPYEAVNLAVYPTWSEELESLRDRTRALRDLYDGVIFKDDFENGDLTAWVVANNGEASLNWFP